MFLVRGDLFGWKYEWLFDIKACRFFIIEDLEIVDKIKKKFLDNLLNSFHNNNFNYKKKVFKILSYFAFPADESIFTNTFILLCYCLHSSPSSDSKSRCIEGNALAIIEAGILRAVAQKISTPVLDRAQLTLTVLLRGNRPFVEPRLRG